MNWIEVPPVVVDPYVQRKALSTFAYRLAATLGVVGGLLAWYGRPGVPYTWGADAIFLAIGLFRPLWLATINMGVDEIGHRIGNRVGEGRTDVLILRRYYTTRTSSPNFFWRPARSSCRSKGEVILCTSTGGWVREPS